MTDTDRILRIGDVLSKYDGARVCVVCGSVFHARTGAKYCSPRCRQAAYRERRKRHVTDSETARLDVGRRVGGMSSVTREWLRRHSGKRLLSVTVGFVAGEPMTMTQSR